MRSKYHGGDFVAVRRATGTLSGVVHGYLPGRVGEPLIIVESIDGAVNVYDSSHYDVMTEGAYNWRTTEIVFHKAEEGV